MDRDRTVFFLEGNRMTPHLAFQLPGGTEWIIILIVALLIFGPRLPSVMRSLGKSLTEFKKGMKGVEDDIKNVDEEPKGDDKKD